MKIILCLFASLYLLSCTQIKHKETKYGLVGDTINFLKIDYKDTLNSEIFLKNFSESEIKILDIETGCGCTSGIVTDSIIQISDSVRIQIRYIPAITKDSGKVIKYITIRTNSNPPFRNIILKGEVNK